MEYHIYFIEDLICKQRIELLSNKLKEIESILNTTVISFYSVFNHNSVRKAFDLINEIELTDSLTFIISSDGGDFRASCELMDYLLNKKRFLRLIVPETCKSAATSFAFCFDEIIVDDTRACFSRTDPQIFTKKGHEISIYSSTQHHMEKLEGIYTLNESSKNKSDLLNISLDKVGDLNKDQKNQYEIITESICLQYSYLFDNHFKNITDLGERHKKTYNFIKSLIIPRYRFSSHNTPIPSCTIKDLGLNLIAYNDQKELYNAITSYHDVMQSAINPDEKENNIGNSLNSVLQSNKRLII